LTTGAICDIFYYILNIFAENFFPTLTDLLQQNRFAWRLFKQISKKKNRFFYLSLRQAV